MAWQFKALAVLMTLALAEGKLKQDQKILYKECNGTSSSNIYGSSATQALLLRTRSGGQMKVTPGRRGSRASGALPACADQKEGAFKMCTGCGKCFVAGNYCDLCLISFRVVEC